MITLVTGTPGAGKTLWTVAELVKRIAPTGRVIYTNINGLDCAAVGENVHAIEDDDALRWMDFPDGSVFVFDEFQHQFPARHGGTRPPPAVEALQTHRHRGMDFYLITQEPSLFDKAIRVLVGRHVHLYRPFNLARAQVFEWPTVNPEPNPAQTHKASKRQQFVFPRKLYSLYKSASQHTMKVNLPWGLLSLLILGVGLAGFMGYRGYAKFHETSTVEEKADPAGDPDRSEAGSAFSSAGPRSTCKVMGRIGTRYLLKGSSGDILALRRTEVLDECAGLY